MKRIVRFMGTPLLVLAMFTITFASSPSIVISNETLPVSAVSKEGRVLVPLRAIFESLNATVDYDSATKTITGNQNGKLIILKINEKVASVDGQNVTLDVPASIIKGSTLVPVRFIGESLGAKVDWHNNTVLINSDRDAVATPVVPSASKPAGTQKTENSKFVGSIESDKYHVFSCRHAKKIIEDNTTYFNSVEDAKKAGYKPCGVCNPR